jgi:hypothetical protein
LFIYANGGFHYQVKVSKGLAEAMQSLSVRLKLFNLFPSPLVLLFSLRYNDETLSIADVIHSDAGGLGKPEAIGDAGQSCSFTLIELII